ncbi:hypothetical protein KGF56_002442 [Candida oxycetoniae]|uniref:DNA-directed RNA polymerase III subunit RPC9 n=1 Tax=Candida oxycetoniae TaxID=497107 RepID=A0AAI9WY42_9ASCO|nr:uncharacterized protein KGF56_002442 [Candida oxycetoniae]KAI3404739.1 hypothetical protein KGF56_002442 [Candida oxycetoniae]
MQILKERDAFLSNFEVEQHLNNIKQKYNWTFTEEDELELEHRIDKDNTEDHGLHKRNNHKQKHRFTECGIGLEIITRDVLALMRNNSACGDMTVDKFEELMQYLNQFELMKIEKLQIINQLPKTMPVLYAIVEECEERFGSDVPEEILSKIMELFPSEEDEDEDDEDEDNNEKEEGVDERGEDEGEDEEMIEEEEEEEERNS